jgi:hypothetical protein
VQASAPLRGDMTANERVLSRNLPLSSEWSPQVASKAGNITGSHEVDREAFLSGSVLAFMIDTGRQGELRRALLRAPAPWACYPCQPSQVTTLPIKRKLRSRQMTSTASSRRTRGWLRSGTSGVTCVLRGRRRGEKPSPSVPEGG